MLIPYTVDVPMERWPFANWALIFVTSVVSLVILVGQIANQHVRRDFHHQGHLAIDEDRFDDFDDGIPPGALRPHDFRLQQLFTCLFVHGDIFHLVGNMIFLFVFGNAVNAKIGHVTYLLAYFLLGAMASAAWLAVGNLPAIGASGAIMGVVGIFLVLYPRNDITVLYAYSIAFSGSFTVSSMWMILFYLVGDLLGTLMPGCGGGVAYVAHLGGAVAGIWWAATAVALGFYRPTRYEQNLLQLMGWEPPTKKKKKKKKRRTEVTD